MIPNTSSSPSGRLISSDRITTLAPGEVFVFGSNARGAHGGGAARYAMDHFGAVHGQGHGLQGQSYAIDTMSGLDAMALDIAQFLTFAAAHPELTFLVTEIGCGIAGYTPAQVAPHFASAPSNVALPASFAALTTSTGALTEAQLDRAVGAVVASAAGDALGSAYEFGPSLPDDQTPTFGVGVFSHGVGEWTDDTSMAIPILEAIARGDSLQDAGVLAQLASRWWEWSLTAPDVGAQTRAVLAPITTVGTDAVTEQFMRDQARAVHEQSGRSGGNGSLMRTGPVALAYLGEGLEADLAEAAGRVAQLTHWEDDNVDAVVLWCLAIRHAILTGELDARAGLAWVPDERRTRWAEIIDVALAPGSHPRDFKGQNGWVVRAFQAALSAVNGADDLPDALMRAVRGGGDTDTVAAIAGSLAGAVWGASQVPEPWKQLVHGWPGYRVDDLARLASTRAATPPASRRRPARPGVTSPPG